MQPETKPMPTKTERLGASFRERLGMVPKSIREVQDLQRPYIPDPLFVDDRPEVITSD